MSLDTNLKECTFCKQPATHCPIAEMSAQAFDIWFCYPCKAEFVRLKLLHSTFVLDENFRCNLYTSIDDRQFKYTMNRDGSIQVFKVGIPGVPGVSYNRDCTMIMYFKPGNKLQITPTNINEKLRTYITFL